MSFPTPQIFQAKRLLQLPASRVRFAMAPCDRCGSGTRSGRGRGKGHAKRKEFQSKVIARKLASCQVGAAIRTAAGKKKSSGKPSNEGRRLPEPTQAEAGVAHCRDKEDVRK